MKYPIGIQDFEKLRLGGYAYVDKTRYVFNLVNRGSYYFLSRPRRFGKSLFLSTLEYYFEGKKDLFKGLEIESLEEDWISYPVFHLDLNPGKYNNDGELDRVLIDALNSWDHKFGIASTGSTIALRFKNLIELVREKYDKRVVVLVDEYDKPMLQTIGMPELQAQYRAVLKGFYSVLKTQDKSIRFAFLTGVTKFGKVSVFSDLNNLEDISMLPQYNGVCGITESELHRYFESGIEEFAAEIGKTVEETNEILRVNFDGYHFVPHSEGIYNPFSLLNTLKNKVLNDYWFETGTPTFLVELLQHSDYDLRRLQEEDVDSDIINSIDSMSKNPIPVIYQSGYLTIKDYDPEFGLYRLGFPNREVELGFTRFLVPYYTPVPDVKTSAFISYFVRDMRAGRVEEFLKRLQALFDDSDYRVAGKMELYFQNAMYLLFRMMGFYTQVERATSRGRIDVTVQTKDYVYIIELKLDGSAEEALRQIEEKQYARPFAMDQRTVYAIGINFSSATRGVEDWKIKEITKE